ncbi:MAG: hypothetical protein IRD7MM_02330 [Candidatus Midichloria mitochondrii]
MAVWAMNHMEYLLVDTSTNGDGKVDIVNANSRSSNISLLIRKWRWNLPTSGIIWDWLGHED